MAALLWEERNRDILSDVLPESVVILPVGATEQHGPHLPTGTDALVAATVATRAADKAAEMSTRSFVLAPCLSFGASEHHLPFGGTLSLSVETMLSVLTDLGRSMALSGAQRVVFVNGHGGNRGACHGAAAILSARHGLKIAIANYWDFVGDESGRIPGHAGEFETAILLALRRELVGEVFHRDRPTPVSTMAGIDVHDPTVWPKLNGYTDEPAEARVERGVRWLDTAVRTLAERFIEIGRDL